MLLFLLAAALFMADPASTAAPAATPAAQPTQPAPLREIVYKISETDMVSQSGTDYYGTASGSGSTGDEGTLTIDILQVAKGNILQVRATELWRSLGSKSYSAIGYVGADGTLGIVEGTYSQSMLAVLPFLGQDYIASHDMSVGTEWILSADTQDKAHIERRYSVTEVDGADVTVTVNGTMKGGIGMFPMTERDTIVYRPSKLVALTGQFETRTLSSSATATQDTTHRFHFERVSDTRDTQP
jgi:hypothetical protein